MATGDSSSLESVSVAGRGSEMLIRVQICGLPCNFMRAFSLYVISSLGHNCVVDWDDQTLFSDSALLEGLKCECEAL